MAMTNNSVTIREVQSRDIPEVVELIKNILNEYNLIFGQGSGTDEEMRRLPNSYSAHGGEFWVALNSNRQVIATCGVFPIGDDIFELRKMYIQKEFRGKGIAPLLLERCLNFVKTHGGKHIVLDTIHEMDRAISFYEKNGFVRDDSQIRAQRCSRGYVRHL